MFILFLLEFNIEDALANGEFTKLFDLLQLMFLCLFGYELKSLKGTISEVRILINFEIIIINVFEVSELIL